MFISGYFSSCLIGENEYILAKGFPIFICSFERSLAGGNTLEFANILFYNQKCGNH